MAELPFEIKEITQYAETFGFDVDMDFFFRAMCELDSEYMTFMALKRESEKEPNP